ncbi:Lsr2 family DNA-binding protein [Streptomyces massasporeus]|uniref:Lsr2 family DNA-binding protein n=1 Tax=Streptomyces massasporeus TaxID=67324 RepID=UPI00381DF9C5
MSTAPNLPTTDATVTAGADVRLKAVTHAPQQIAVGQLLAWGDKHPDADVQDQAARARIALHGLRQRHAADQELAAIDSEEEQLAKRLAELRERKAKLAPAKAKKPRKHVDYPAAEVRAWAKGQGIDCPATGRVPRAVVDAWRAAQPKAG